MKNSFFDKMIHFIVSKGHLIEKIFAAAVLLSIILLLPNKPLMLWKKNSVIPALHE